MRRRTGLIALDELAGLKKKWPILKKISAKSLKLAKWTFLPNMAKKRPTLIFFTKYGEPSSMGTS